MATLRQQKIPSSALPVFKQAGIKIKGFKSVAEFERVLIKFLKRNNVLHLSTTRNDLPRTTPLEYRLDGLTFYILSEGGGKFINLKANPNVSFSIAEPYDAENDYFGAEGLQAWGKAKVYSKKTDPHHFERALQRMKVYEMLKKLGRSELPPQFNFRVIEITLDRMTLSAVREGVYRVTWKRKG